MLTKTFRMAVVLSVIVFVRFGCGSTVQPRRAAGGGESQLFQRNQQSGYAVPELVSQILFVADELLRQHSPFAR